MHEVAPDQCRQIGINWPIQAHADTVDGIDNAAALGQPGVIGDQASGGSECSAEIFRHQGRGPGNL